MRIFGDPRFAQAPADADNTGSGDTTDTDEVDPAAAGDDAGEKDAEGKSAKGADDQAGKGKKPAAAAAGEKGAKDKGQPKGKSTLLGKTGTAKAGDAAGAGKDDGEGKGGGESDLDAWKPTIPDGTELDEELLGEAKTWGKQHGLKGEQLQGVVDLGLKMQQRAAQALIEAHEAYVQDLTSKVKADKEIGGGKLEKTIESALGALKRFAGADYETVRSELDRTGLGSHPAVIRFLAKIAKATAEDDTLERTSGGKEGAKPANPMSRFTAKMYPKMNKELARERGEDVDDDA